ncbi:MAG: hypothetical protein K9M44_00605 [Candidatus Pacebacteria bacterium]|nr:hypothetical protein [Candidatus Paceibacterota bacterium]
MIKILGQINLENLPQEKPKFNFEKYKGFLQEKMSALAERVNKEHGEILNADGSIKVSNQDDLALIKAQEEAWASETGIGREAWLEKKESNKAEMTEKVITLVLDKMLGDDFVVVRASSFDDYNNGVDNVILDKRTGQVVCGFDDVISRDGENGSEKKAEKVKRVMAKGGAKLKYGLDLKGDGSIETGQLKNLPAFYLALSKDDLASALKVLENNGSVSDFQELGSKLLLSLDDQIKNVDRDDLDNDLLFNLSEFEHSLFEIKQSFLSKLEK